MVDERKIVVLQIVSGPGNGTQVKLGAGRHIVGSGAGCAIQISDDSVAALHAMIIVGDDVLRVYPIQRTVLLAKSTDQHGDANAVEVNGTELVIGQHIHIGDATVVLLQQESVAPLASDDGRDDHRFEITQAEFPHANHPDMESDAWSEVPVPRIVEGHADDSLEVPADLAGETTVGIESIDGSPIAAATSDQTASGQAGQDAQQSAVKHAVLGVAANAVRDIRDDQGSDAAPTIKTGNKTGKTLQMGDRLGPYGRAKDQQQRQQVADETFETPAPKPIQGSQVRRPRDPRRLDAPSPDGQLINPTNAAQRTVNRAAAASARHSNRAMIAVPASNGNKANEAFALVAVGAVEVSDNIKDGFLAFWREGISVSRPLVITALLASMIGLLFIADRQTEAVNDYSVSPARSLTSELSNLGFSELTVTEDEDNRIHLNGFVSNDQQKRALNDVIANYDQDTFFKRDVVVATELLDGIGDVLVQYGMSGLERTYLGDGHVQIDGYVGPEHDWDDALNTLQGDFPVIKGIDDSGVETQSVRLAELKKMLADVGLKNLTADPVETAIEVSGALPIQEIGRWQALMDRFKTKYDNNPQIVNRVEEIVPGQLSAVDVQGTMLFKGRVLLTTGQGMFREGDTMPDGTKIIRVEQHGIVFGRNGYEYLQPFNSMQSYNSSNL